MPKAMEETYPACEQVKSDKEGGVDFLFGLDQATTTNEQLSSHAHLENVDQRKCGSTLKVLQSKKA